MRAEIDESRKQVLTDGIIKSIPPVPCVERYRNYLMGLSVNQLLDRADILARQKSMGMWTAKPIWEDRYFNPISRQGDLSLELTNSV